ncbi:hypothetical protein PVA17_18690 [Lysinibacillus sp. CNPSo 3705]|uniref:hypothetical protein n=1 Tax=Lysinibacillus sp. CNPSo 3705 TaxID=3028148 RepID=UPI0023649D40|nr:hypothetical protein [Lysinibacillus sp. CNPSo 3705]MDD1504774.1 hypothetical protein [Lysinibacillus sp. CNPSo 3705]
MFRLGTLLLPLRFRYRKHLLLPLRFRTENICCCRFAFAQKTFVAAASLSHRKHPLRCGIPAGKRVAWNGNHPLLSHTIKKFPYNTIVFQKYEMRSNMSLLRIE